MELCVRVSSTKCLHSSPCEFQLKTGDIQVQSGRERSHCRGGVTELPALEDTGEGTHQPGLQLAEYGQRKGLFLGNL